MVITILLAIHISIEGGTGMKFICLVWLTFLNEKMDS